MKIGDMCDNFCECDCGAEDDIAPHYCIDDDEDRAWEEK